MNAHIRNMTLKYAFKKQHQGGAALVISLIMLVVITILAISGMNTATTELAMARNDQNSENAFQAAESGLEQSVSVGGFTTQVDVTITQGAGTNLEVSTVTVYENWTMVPDRAFSLGVGSGVAAFHFNTTATASSLRSVGNTTDRDASAVHSQAFYVVGPAPATF